jgi:hypothetical protein
MFRLLRSACANLILLYIDFIRKLKKMKWLKVAFVVRGWPDIHGIIEITCKQ